MKDIPEKKNKEPKGKAFEVSKQIQKSAPPAQITQQSGEVNNKVAKETAPGKFQAKQTEQQISNQQDQSIKISIVDAKSTPQPQTNQPAVDSSNQAEPNLKQANPPPQKDFTKFNKKQKKNNKKDQKNNKNKKDKNKKNKDELEDDSEIQEGGEIEMDDQNLVDDIESIAQVTIKKPNSLQDRLVLDLMEIFLNKTNHPETFLASVIDLCQSITNSMKDKQKIGFHTKVVSLIKRFTERNTKYSPEIKDKLDECIQVLFQTLKSYIKNQSKLIKISRTSDKSINRNLGVCFISFLSSRFTIFESDKEGNKLHVDMIMDSLKQWACQRDVCLSDDFFKDLIKTFPSVSAKMVQVFSEIINLNDKGGCRDIMRKFVLNIFSSLLNQQSMSKELSSQLVKNQELLIASLKNVFENYASLKKQINKTLNKYLEILNSIKLVLQTNKSDVKCTKLWDALSNSLKEVAEKYPQKDNAVAQIKTRLLSF